MADAGAREHGENVGRVAQTQPTKHRPGPCDNVSERPVTLSGTQSRAVGSHSSSPEQRRQQRFAREIASSRTTLAAAVGEGTKQEDCGRAEAEAAAAKGRALQRSSHTGEVVIEARPP